LQKTMQTNGAKMRNKTRDEKSCENCVAYRYLKPFPCYNGVQQNKNGVCDKWKRNPSLWLQILPDETGWYWWRRIGWAATVPKKTCKELTDRSVKPIFATKSFSESAYMKKTWMYGGEWQGPIKPCKQRENK